MQLRKLSSRGDTIVEVLIAVAVIGAVLGGAYTVVNRNIKNNQQSQEQTKAVKLAEAQLEQLRRYVSVNPSVPTGNFCLATSGSLTTTAAITQPSQPSTYPTECKIPESLLPGDAVQRVEASVNNQFRVLVEWDGPNGTRSQVSMAYKVYK